jgi:hypothetical protein
MKKIVVSAFVIAFSLSLCNNSQAQDWKKFANKAKDKVKEEVKSEAAESSSSNSNSDQSDSKESDDSGNSGSGVFSGGIEDFLQEKYSTIKANETNLSIYTLERGECDPKKHNAGAKKLDYAATVAKLKADGKLLSTDHRYTDVMKYGKEYADIFNSVLKPLVNKTIEDAYAVKAGNQNQAIEYAHNAQLIAEAASLILYDNADAKQLKEDADKALNAIGGEYYSKLYVSDFHKNNVGKIFFSTKPIIPGKEDPSQFITSASGTDKIYAIVYFNAKIKDLGDQISYDIIIDGNNNNTPQFNPNQSDLEHSYYLVEIIPDANVAVHQFDPVQFGKVLSSLSPRKHVMNFDFIFGYGEKVATGTLNLDWSNADGAAILANSETALKNAKDNKARNMQLPEEFSKPSKAFTDPDLTVEKIKAAIMENADYSENIKQITKVVIGDKFNESQGDWVLFKNELGIPTHKECNRTIYIIFTGKDGWCYFSDVIVFRKDYGGAGTYENTRLASFSSSTYYTRIACENIKK